MMVRSVLLARGGTTGTASGLGRAHHDLIKALDSEMIEGYAVGGVIEHPTKGNPATRLNRRWRTHPARVKASLDYMDLLHISDQEQAHLVPENCPIPVTVTVHDLFHLFPRIVDEIEVGEQNPGKVRRKDLEKLRAGLARADLLICDSQATLKEVQEHFPSVRSTCVPLGLSLDERHPTLNPLKKPTWMEEEGKHLMMVGSEEARKRLAFAILAVSDLEKVILHKIGSESNSKDEEAIKALAQWEGVDLRWQGRIPELELMAAWQHADALLFPSIAEGFGYPPLEAMAGGTRPLVADVGSANELAPAQYLLPTDDFDAWKQVITDLPKGRCERSLEEAKKFSDEVFGRNMATAWDSMF